MCLKGKSKLYIVYSSSYTMSERGIQMLESEAEMLYMIVQKLMLTTNFPDSINGQAGVERKLHAQTFWNETTLIPEIFNKHSLMTFLYTVSRS